jgi:hypothetical protein
MRMMMRLTIDTDAGNCAIRDRSIEQILEESLKRLKPEAAYFYPENGMRAGLLVFNMDDPSEIPAMTEPLFQELGAKVSFTPVMSLDDLRKGLQALANRPAA